MRIIIITGTPGTGKTSISKLISDYLNAKLVSLNTLVISKNFVQKYDEERETYVADFVKLKKFLKELIKNSKNEGINFCIIEGHFADVVPNKYITLSIILRCHPDILKERLKNRNYNEKKIKENMQAEILGNSTNYILQKNLKCPLYEIDTSYKTIRQISEIIIDMIQKDGFIEKYKVGNIDWLEELSNQDRLNEFFD